MHAGGPEAGKQTEAVLSELSLAPMAAIGTCLLFICRERVGMAAERWGKAQSLSACPRRVGASLPLDQGKRGGPQLCLSHAASECNGKGTRWHPYA